MMIKGEYIEPAVVALFVLLQLSMIVLIVACCRHDTSFRQAFYAQFVAVTIVDCLKMLIVRPCLSQKYLYRIATMRTADGPYPRKVKTAAENCLGLREERSKRILVSGILPQKSQMRVPSG